MPCCTMSKHVHYCNSLYAHLLHIILISLRICTHGQRVLNQNDATAYMTCSCTDEPHCLLLTSMLMHTYAQLNSAGIHMLWRISCGITLSLPALLKILRGSALLTSLSFMTYGLHRQTALIQVSLLCATASNSIAR
jgi:Na+/phosphate symporter